MSFRIWLLFSVWLGFAVAHAEPLSPALAPEPLKPWINWVLQDKPDYNCPFVFNAYEPKWCGWTTHLTLDLNDRQGKFTLQAKAFGESWINLPGNEAHWPQSVSVDGKAAEVANRDGLPAIKLTGNGSNVDAAQIKGEYFWDSLPETLAVPANTGLFELIVNGQPLSHPEFKDGQIWIKSAQTRVNQASRVENKIALQVYRRIIDEIPLQLTTRLVLDISGEQREYKLAVPMPNGFIPLTLESALPARLENDGSLRLQLRPGRWQIDLTSRSAQPVDALPLNPVAGEASRPENSWPVSEIWVFDARPALRVAEVEGVTSVDANLTTLPDDWKGLPTYQIEAGQSMRFKTIRRGDPEPEPSQLSLTRKLWLDFDGNGYTVNDQIGGKMTRGWRLNALPEIKLGKITLDGSDQLVTRLAGSGKEGVEVRRGQIALQADSRFTGEIGNLSAAGWDQTFQAVNTELNLPPGWHLLAASGVDNVPDSWINRWTLLDFFMVLIAAYAAKMLWTPLWGFIVLIGLALIWHEAGAPHFVWLNILAATGLIRVLPNGRFMLFAKGYRSVCWLFLVLAAVPFMINQVRIGLYPQLELPWQNIASPSYQTGLTLPAAAPAAEMPIAMKSMEENRAPRRSLGKEYVADAVSEIAQGMGYVESKSFDLKRNDPNAKVQTGPGLPNWQWHKVRLTWNGAVDPEQRLKLWFLSPAVVLLLNLLRVALIAILALLMFGITEKWNFGWRMSQASVLAWLLLPVFALPPRPAQADFPNPALLEELKKRLLETPDCLPACAEIAMMQTAIGAKDLMLTLEIHAQRSVAVPLPGDAQQWFPSRVSIDGNPASALLRQGNNLWLSLEKGRHKVVMQGALPPIAKFTLPLPLKPHRVAVEGDGWEVIGIQEHGIPGEQLQFERVRQTANDAPQTALTPGVLPAFVRIERTLQLSLDWQVVTRIVRLSPANSPVLLAVPVLPGEAVTTPGVRVKDGKVEVNMAENQTVTQWQSTLEKSDKIELAAAATDNWIEVYNAEISPIWHVEATGIAMIYLNHDQGWVPEWRPWPGEKVVLAISRPDAVEGQTLTIDNSRLAISPGLRTRSADLSLSLRSSQGGQHTLTLPDSATLQTVTIDGVPQPLRQEGRKLVLPVRPGLQSISLRWLEALPIGVKATTPTVDLGAASVNTSLNISLGQDRWVLWVGGPKMGPAVLFWGVLIVMAALSFGLGRAGLAPLKPGHWFLLFVGLSQIPLPAALVVVAWLLLLGWRNGKSAAEIRMFNALQVVLGGLTLLSLAALFYAVSHGLLQAPDMLVTGNLSTPYNLNWYQDRSAALLPTATVISVPLKVYRLLMLAWSLWLAGALLRWLKWGWQCFSSNGFWDKKPMIAHSDAKDSKTKE